MMRDHYILVILQMGTMFESERRFRDACELFEYVGRSGEPGEAASEKRTLPASLATLQVHVQFPLELWSGAAPPAVRLRALYRLAFLLILEALHPSAPDPTGTGTSAARPPASAATGASGGAPNTETDGQPQAQQQQQHQAETQAALVVALQHLELAIELAKRQPAHESSSSSSSAPRPTYAELLADDSLVMPAAPHVPSLGLLHYLHGRSFASLNRVQDAFVAYRCSIDQLETNADTWCSIGCASRLSPSLSLRWR